MSGLGGRQYAFCALKYLLQSISIGKLPFQYSIGFLSPADFYSPQDCVCFWASDGFCPFASGYVKEVSASPASLKQAFPLLTLCNWLPHHN